MVKRTGWQSIREACITILLICAALVGLSIFVLTAQAGGDGAISQPTMPVSLKIPTTPIIATSGHLGYLPGSGSVGSDGQYTYTIPLEVPAGRAGMQPHLSLSYSSGGGNGVLGVGWSLSGLSAITRCGRTLSTEGVVFGVHHTTSTVTGMGDRLCLNGRKLMGISGIYGEPNSEYRTEEDGFSKIVAMQDPGNKSPGALIFTVQTRDGHTLSYKGMYGAAKFSQSLLGSSNISFYAPEWWGLASEVDEAGNGVQYNYSQVMVSHPASWANAYNLGNVYVNYLTSIVYTTGNDSSGKDSPDSGHRKVVLTYEDLPSDTSREFQFQDGVPSLLAKRLKTVTMWAPNPGKTAPVWQYDITYTKSTFSNRSLLNTVKRCALNTAKNADGSVEGGCTWTKKFDWTTTVFHQGQEPQWTGNWQTWGQTTVGGLNIITGYLNNNNPDNYPYVSEGATETGVGLFKTYGTWYQKFWPDNPPVIRVMDLNGDGRDDVLFQTGGPAGPDVKVILSDQGPLATMGELGELSNVNDPDSGGNRQALQRSYPLDMNGDGSAELYVTQAHMKNGKVLCQNKILHYINDLTGFADIGLNLPKYDCANPFSSKYSDLFLDVDGDGRLDHLQAGTFDFGGPTDGTNKPVPELSMLSAVVPGPWTNGQINQGGTLGPMSKIIVSESDMVSKTASACQVYAVDFTGDGRAQLFGQGDSPGAIPNFDFSATGQSPFYTIFEHASNQCQEQMVTSYYSPALLDGAPNGQWVQQIDYGISYPDKFNPKYPAIPMNATNAADPDGANAGWVDATKTPKLIFGDFNGDGLVDVIEPAVDMKNDSYWSTKGGLAIRWNTGNGFGPEIPLCLPYHDGLCTPWYDGTPDVSIYTTDINHDGRTDLVVFHRTGTPAITIMLSNGDGTFTSTDVNEASGRTDPGLQACVTNNSPKFHTTSCSIVAGIGDFNGDGFADLIRLEPDLPLMQGQTTANAKLQYMLQVPTIADRIASVTDEGTNWPREQVSYDWKSSDKPEAVAACTYPQRCNRRGFPVVRKVTNWDTVANSAPYLTGWHTVYYSYEDPVSDLRGRGGLGFRKERMWDPVRMQQTITLYDNRAETAGKYYIGAGRAQSVTTVTAIPSSKKSDTLPVLPRGGIAKTNARVSHTDYHYALKQTNGNQTYMIEPSTGGTPAIVTSEWEQMVSMAANVNDPADPTSDYMWGIVMPKDPAWQHSTVIPNGGIDDYGNITSKKEITKGGVITETKSTYNNITTPPTWILGQLASQTVTVTEADPAVAPVTRTVGYDYYPNGLLQNKKRYQVTKGNTSLISMATLSRDGYGNITSMTTQASGPDGKATVRVTNVEYDPLWPGQPNERIYPSQTWVPVSLSTGTGTWTPSDWTLIHPAYGVVSASMDVNGVQSSAVYDDQGRLRKVIPAVGMTTTLAYAPRPDVQSGNNGLIVTAVSGGQTTQNLTDAAGRTIQTTHLAFDGKVTTDGYIKYDSLGRAISVSRPYTGTSIPSALPAGTTYFTTTTYDGLNRPIKVVGPDGATTTRAYTFFADNDTYPAYSGTSSFTRIVSRETTIDPDHNYIRIDTDVDGRVMQTANKLTPKANGNDWQATMIHFAAFGQVDRVILPSKAMETSSYDTLGRVLEHYSPDGGTLTNLSYDGFSELLSTTHKESGAKTTAYFDALGRSTGWSTKDPSTGVTTNSTIAYDSRPNGLGKKAKATSSDHVAIVYNYDAYGRSTGIEETIGERTYVTGISYDNSGRLSQVTYPSIGVNPGPGLSLQYNYNNYEYLTSMSHMNADPTSTMPVSAALWEGLWTVTSRNPDGSLAEATLLAGANPLNLGTLTNTYLPQTGQLQEAKYTANYSSTGAPATANLMDLNYTYYPNRLVKTRNDSVNGRLESFRYDTLNRLRQWNLSACGATCAQSSPKPFRQYEYSRDGNLLSVSSYNSNNSTWTPIQANTYGGGGGGPHAVTKQTSGPLTSIPSYDLQGRQTNNGAGRTMLYNAFDLPRTVTQNGKTWKLQYDAFGRRASKVGPDGATIYIGGIFEQRIAPGGKPVIDVFKVPGIGQVETDESTGTVTKLFTLKDTLGSTSNVVQGSTTETVINTFFYDPFGARINADGSDYTAALKGDVHDGFTGQEHDDSFGLINFQGRMYDPKLKRFLSVDPHITHPLFGQSYNPYTYALNSPLNVTDATGFDDDDGGSDAAYSGTTVQIDFTVSPGTAGPASGSFCDGPACPSGGGKAASDISGAGLNQNVCTGCRGPDGSTARFGLGPSASMGSTADLSSAGTPAQSGASDNGGYAELEPASQSLVNGGVYLDAEDRKELNYQLLMQREQAFWKSLSFWDSLTTFQVKRTREEQELVDWHYWKRERTTSILDAMENNFWQYSVPMTVSWLNSGGLDYFISPTVPSVPSARSAPNSRSYTPGDPYTDAAALARRVEAAGGTRVIYVGPPRASDGQSTAQVIRTNGNRITFDSPCNGLGVRLARIEAQRAGHTDVIIGTFTHGDEAGNTAATVPQLAEPKFGEADRRLNPGQTLFDMRDESDAAFFGALESLSADGSTPTISGWCFSSNHH